MDVTLVSVVVLVVVMDVVAKKITAVTKRFFQQVLGEFFFYRPKFKNKFGYKVKKISHYQCFTGQELLNGSEKKG